MKMSASDEEAFESAEEGESGNPEAKTSKGKPRGGSGSSKAPPSAGGDKAKGKQKGKQQQQQQQQRKTKTKAQAKPAPDKTEKPAAEKSSKAKKPEAKSSKAESEKKTKAETDPAPGSPGAVASEPPKSPAVRPQAESESSGGDAQGSVAEKDSRKETPTEENTAEKVPDTEKSNETVTPAESSEAQDASAGEVRRNVSSSTEDPRAKNPADQSIPRDSGDTVEGSAEEEKEQKASGGSEDEGGWDWGWGSSLLNAATNSLETFSSQVGEGLTTIIDTVESSFGVPDPQELARDNTAEESDPKPEESQTVTVQPHEKEGSEKPQTEKEGTGAKGKVAEEEEEKEEEEEGAAASGARAEEEEGKPEPGSSWLSGWGMSSFSSMGKSLVNKSQNLMNTGFEKAESLAAGGLDILETIGKKTYTTLTEHDPGLRRAREFLHMGDKKPSLSSVLREAQEQAEEEAKHNQEMEEARKCCFTALFEDNQGLAHLEALEMLSNGSERKVQSLLSAMEEETLQTIRLQLLDIKDVFQKACEAGEKEQPDETEHDFSKLVTENLSELHLGTGPDKLNKVQETVRQWIADFYSHEDHSEISDPKEVQQHAIQSLADVTSKAVEQFHKAGELVLMQRDEETSCSHRAQSLAKLCSVLVTEVDILANKFSQCLNKIGEEKNSTEEVSPMVTSVYLEASNASGYIQDAFQLLLPVLQHAAIQSVL